MIHIALNTVHWTYNQTTCLQCKPKRYHIKLNFLVQRILFRLSQTLVPCKTQNAQIGEIRGITVIGRAGYYSMLEHEVT
jgi:hypothetical protein